MLPRLTISWQNGRASGAHGDRKDRSMPQDSVGVVTLTRGRAKILRRAMASVRAQEYDGEIEHVIVVDDEDPDTLAAVDGAPARPGLRVTVRVVPRPAA